MPIATVTSKGQITIPQDVRERLGIVTGTRVEFAELADGRVEFIPITGSIMDIKGVVVWDGEPATLEDFDAAIGEHVSESDRISKR